MMRFTLKDFCISVAVLLVLAGVVYGTNQKPSPLISKAASDDNGQVSKLASVHSPDGTMKLVLQTTIRPDRHIAYILTVSDADGSHRQSLNEGSLPEGSEIALPANSWSPDNKFVFLKINSRSGGELSVHVFQANGSAFADGQPSVDVASLFQIALADLTLRDVTGWDDPALLHIMTYNADKTFGPSYWFDIWSRSFIPLAHR